MLVSRCKFWCLSICTLGLYAAYYYLLQYCYRIRCCVPKLISMQRGVMVLTNHCRLLVWATEVEQTKISAPRVRAFARPPPLKLIPRVLQKT